MKNIRSLIFAAALATPAFAIDWTVTYPGSQPLAFLSSGNSFQNNFASLTTVGFQVGNTPGKNTVTSAFASFWFADDSYNGVADSNDEYVNVYVNGIKLNSSPVEVDGLHPESSYQRKNFAITDANTLLALQNGSGVSFKVEMTLGAGQSNIGDTYLKIASLTATGGVRPPNTPGVPDGGSSVAMLGLGLIALVGAGRRLKS